ncbi:adenine deaminase C-terminal domain-containing protein, partial [Endozoicomonas sp. SESOKO1]|uniref:adenine deaminase C-terminal domain-containing protein n=1 Tax=Endozoicomonas sp. SESOKO1 TaxID=2828742 RepID=UPI0027D2F7DB
KIPAITPADMKVFTDLKADKVNVLSMEVDFDVPFVRRRRDVQLKVENGVVLPDVDNDVLYATVVERFGKNGNKPVAFVSGWKLKAGAMASSKAPDDNNIVCIGTNSEDMSIAINYLAEQGGGQVIVKDGEVMDFIHLPICGITSDISPEAMAEAERKMKAVTRELGCDLPDPIFYMCCLEITAIPDYAMTDLGAVSFAEQNVFNPVLSAAE